VGVVWLQRVRPVPLSLGEEEILYDLKELCRQRYLKRYYVDLQMFPHCNACHCIGREGGKKKEKQNHFSMLQTVDRIDSYPHKSYRARGSCEVQS
jgi:hypothetical protein